MTHEFEIFHILSQALIKNMDQQGDQCLQRLDGFENNKGAVSCTLYNWPWLLAAVVHEEMEGLAQLIGHCQLLYTLHI